QQHMLGRNDFLDVLGLGSGESLTYAPIVCPINERHGTGEHRAGAFLAVLCQRMSYQLGNHLRTAGESSLLDHDIELREQLLRQAHAQTGELGSRCRAHVALEWGRWVRG